MNLVLRLGLQLALLILLITPLVHLLKVIHVSGELGAYLLYVGLPLVTLLIVLGGLLEPNSPQERPNLLLALTVAMLGTSALVTFHYQGDLVDIAGNVMRLLFAFSAVFVLTNSGAAYRAFISERIFLLAKMFLATSAAATLLMHAASLAGFVVYFGLQTTPAFLSFAYGLVNQRISFVLLSLVPLIGAGKRGTMLGAVLILVAYVAMAIGRVHLGRVVTLLAVLAVTLVSSYAFQLLPENVASRLDFLFSDEDLDINTVTSGRLNEASAALQKLAQDPSAWLTGFGLGSAISLEAFADSTVSTVHFSPLAMVLIFGGPLTFLFYAVLAYYVAVFFMMCREGRVSRDFVVVYLVFLAEIVFSLTAFSILHSYLLWLSLAYLIACRSRVARRGLPLSGAGGHYTPTGTIKV